MVLVLTENHGSMSLLTALNTSSARTSIKVMLSPFHDLQMLRTMSPHSSLISPNMATPPCSHRGASPPPHTGRSLGPGPPLLTPSRCPRPTLALHGDGQLTGVPTGREGMPLPTSVTPLSLPR